MNSRLRQKLPRIGGGLLLIIIMIVTIFEGNHIVQTHAAVSRITTPYVAARATPVIFVHGISGILGSTATDCQQEWGRAIKYLRQPPNGVGFTGPMVKIGYYTQDTNCTTNLSTPNSIGRSHCYGYDSTDSSQTPDPAVGTNDESIRHIACELAWYLYIRYSQSQQNVHIVTYSMGGLITRYALYGVQDHLSAFPPSLFVRKVVDFDTPNGGFPGPGQAASGPNPYLCTGCLEMVQMYRNGSAMSDFMSELDTFAQNPQESEAGTRWTILGTVYGVGCDLVVAPESSLYMNWAYKVFYQSPCYPHTHTVPGSIPMMWDTSATLDATVFFCTGCPESSAQNRSTWLTSSVFPHSLQLMFQVLSTSLSIATVTDSSGHDGCLANTLPANDDNSSSAITLPYTLNFFGITYNSVFVNNNGYVTFDAPLNDYTPYPLTSTSHAIIAPYFADVDTRGVGANPVTYGSGIFQNHTAFCVNWINVGYYAQHMDRINSFQLLLVDRSDRKPGDFDIVMNYSEILWETGDASGGSGGLGGTSARAGFTNGNPSTAFELFGSGVNGAFLDSNTGLGGLAFNNQNNSLAGRYVYAIQNTGSSVPGKVSTVPPHHKVKTK